MTVDERDLIFKKLETAIYNGNFNCLYSTTAKCECMTCKFLNFSLNVIANVVGDTAVPEWKSCGKNEEECPKIELGVKCSCNHKPTRKRKHCSGCEYQRIPYLYDKPLLGCMSKIDNNSIYNNPDVMQVIRYAISILGHIQKRHHEVDNNTKEEIVKMFLALSGIKVLDCDYKISSPKNQQRIHDLRLEFANANSLSEIESLLTSSYKDMTCGMGYKEKMSQDDFDYACFVHVLENMMKDKSPQSEYNIHLFLDKSTEFKKNQE